MAAFPYRRTKVAESTLQRGQVRPEVEIIRRPAVTDHSFVTLPARLLGSEDAVSLPV